MGGAAVAGWALMRGGRRPDLRRPIRQPTSVENRKRSIKMKVKRIGPRESFEKGSFVGRLGGSKREKKKVIHHAISSFSERTNKCEPCYFFDPTFLKLAFAFFLRSSSLLQPKSQSCFVLVPPLTTFLICTRGKETLRIGTRAFIMVSLVIGPFDFFIPFFACNKAQRSKLKSIDSSNRCSATAPAPR